MSRNVLIFVRNWLIDAINFGWIVHPLVIQPLSIIDEYDL